MLLMVTVKRGNLAVRRAKDDNGFESYRLLAKQHVTRNNKQSTDLLLAVSFRPEDRGRRRELGTLGSGDPGVRGDAYSLGWH